jgi:hypothetical protein
MANSIVRIFNFISLNKWELSKDKFYSFILFYRDSL